ncbi:hypothetical protein L1049_010015 [Liquidambar formosana]|uniref:Uncharacterized protein n=1 Tax=Liquidambar formosana TaxID=63359 RepID=A0AAP0N6S8_LIQFO
MWSTDKNFPARGFSTPPATWKSKKPSSYSPMMMMPLSEQKQRSSPSSKADLFHVIHKVPTGDSPYVRAKHVQLIDRDPSKAISLFWAAINSGDRVDSALKDMAVVMKQLNRTDEAIEAIKSFRHLCPHESQESLDNVLVELYKRSGRVEEEIEMLQLKLKHIEEGIAFGGKRTKIARSQGKKIQITIEQERSRILGNLAWAYLQQNNYKTAEELYRKAIFLDPDKNKKCNLAFCLMHMNRLTEAKFLLQAVKASSKDGQMDESYAKSYERAFQMLTELESQAVLSPPVKEENPDEIRRSFTSSGNRSSKELTTSTNGGWDNISGSVHSRRCTDGNDEETMPLKEQSRDIYCQNNFVNKNTFSRYDKRNSEGLLFQPRSGVQCSPQTFFVDKWKKGAYHENPPERSTDFASKRMENRISVTETEVGSACKKTYASPVYVREYPKVPLTQPRRGSCFFNRGDQRLGLWGDRAVGSSSRKLSFEQPITTVENVQALAPQNHNGELLASVNESSKVALQKWQTGSPFTIGEDWRRSSSVDLTKGKNVAVTSSLSQITMNGNWDRNLCENDGQMKFATNNSQANPKLLMELPISVDDAKAMKPSIDGAWEQSSDVTASGSVRSTGTAEEKSFGGNNFGLHEPIVGNPKPTQDLPLCESKKSWADMVEEEEQELSSGRTDFPGNKWNHPFHECSYSIQNPSHCLDGWDSGEEFSNENLNSNIIRQSPCPLDQTENLRQKLESLFDLKDGYTKSGNDNSSRNTTARRSLCFDQQQSPDPVDYFCSSPLPRKALNFEGNNCVPADERDSSFGKNIIPEKKNKRLQVFRDITLHPESP